MGYRIREYDRLIVGAGGLGTSVAYHLSGYPGRTLVLERFYENHPFGSSHGRTRILRTAYSEGATFIPLVLRARYLWKRLGEDVEQQIFRPTGVLLAGSSDSAGLAAARDNARRCRLPHELLDVERARQRFPAFKFARGDGVLWDPGGGVLFPERAIRGYRRKARLRGVNFRWNSPVVRWRPRSGGRILVRTTTREYLAHAMVLSAGAWLSRLVPDLRLPLRVEQQTVFWFRASHRPSETYRTMPAFVWYNSARGYSYGTPDLGDGVKIGGSEGQPVPNLARRPPTAPRELRGVRRFLADRLPGLSTEPIRWSQCLYTNSPDKNFIVDFHPDYPNVVLASACSGHGFKFASALGELIARAVSTGRLPPLLVPFRLPGPLGLGTDRAGPDGSGSDGRTAVGFPDPVN